MSWFCLSSEFFQPRFFKRSNKAWLSSSMIYFDVNKVYAVGKIAIQCHFRFCSWCLRLVRRLTRDMNRLPQPPPNVAPSAAWPPRHATTGSCRSLKSCWPWWARAGWWWKLQRWHRDHQSACQWPIGGWFRLEQAECGWWQIYGGVSLEMKRNGPKGSCPIQSWCTHWLAPIKISFLSHRFDEYFWHQLAY